MKILKMTLIVLTVGALLLSACGRKSDTAEPADATATSAPRASTATSAAEPPTKAAPTKAPTRAPATATAVPPTATPVPEPTAEELSLTTVTEGLGVLSSYKSDFRMTFEGKDENGKQVTSSWDMQEEFIREPRAQKIVVKSSDSSDEQQAMPGAFEIITIEDTSYMITSDSGDGTPGCISFSSSETTAAEQAMYTPDMLGGISGAKYVGTETVNGVRAKHYAWDESSISFLGIGSASGDVWVAADAQYAVRYRTQATGSGTLFGADVGEGTITVEYDLTEVNGSFRIEPPDDCQVPATDIPIMADAKDRSSIGGMVTYSSPSSLNDVVDFYKQEMVNSGWSAEEGGVEMEGLVMMNFSKDDRQAQLMISFDTDSKMTTVIITTGDE